MCGWLRIISRGLFQQKKLLHFGWTLWYEDSIEGTPRTGFPTKFLSDKVKNILFSFQWNRCLNLTITHASSKLIFSQQTLGCIFSKKKSYFVPLADINFFIKCFFFLVVFIVHLRDQHYLACYIVKTSQNNPSCKMFSSYLLTCKTKQNVVNPYDNSHRCISCPMSIRTM